MSTTRRTILMGSFALLAAPVGVGAQQTGKVYRIGWLGLTPASPTAHTPSSQAFVDALRAHGFTEGQIS